jgi:hypothetical protein
MKRLKTFLQTLALSVLLFTSPVWAYTETFYVRADGTGGSPETSCATAGSWDMDDFNTAGNWDTDDQDDGQIGLNDQVIFCDDGGAFRPSGSASYFQPKGSGTSGNPITITGEAGGSPVISGSDLLVSWTQSITSVLSDDFDDNDLTGWTESGGVANTNNRLETTISGGGSDYIQKDVTVVGDEAYMQFTFTLVSGYSNWGNNELSTGSGFRDDAPQYLLHVGVADDSGTKRLQVSYSTDVASNTYVEDDYTFNDDTAYTIKLYVKISSGADDGIYEVFVNDVSAWTVTGQDNDTMVFDHIRVGNAWSNDFDATFYNDDLEVWEPNTTSNDYIPNIWYSSELAADPNVAWLDDVSYLEAADAESVDATNRWFWSAGDTTLHVYGTSDPSTFYSSSGVQAPVDIVAAYINQSWLVIEDIEFSYGLNFAVDVDGGDNNVFDNLTITGSGLYAAMTILGDANSNTLQNSTLDGKNIVVASDTLRLDENAADSGNKPTSNTIQYNTIKNGSHCGFNLREADDNIIQYNIFDTDSSVWGRNVEIKGEADTGGNIFRYNLVTDSEDGAQSLGKNQFAGVGNQIYYNVFSGNANNGIWVSDWTEGSWQWVAKDNVFYGNVIYGFVGSGIDVDLDDAGSSGNLFKNNIIFSNDTDNNYQVEFAGSGITKSDFQYNIIWDTDTTSTVYDGSTARTVAYMEANYSGQWSNNLISQPLVVNAAVDNFTLRSSSPAIDAGVDLGASYDDALKSSSVWPSGVVIADQDNYGTGVWEIGAYIYSRSGGLLNMGMGLNL